MSTFTDVHPSTSSSRLLRPELLDGITDAVISSSDRLARAETICRLVHEIYDSVAWIHPDLVDDELTSLRRLVEEADAHARQVAQPGRTPSMEVWS